MTHWQQRVNERIGNVCPEELRRDLTDAISQGNTDFVEFVSRLSKSGRRLFRFRVPDGRVFYAVYCTSRNQPMTVMPPGFTVNREGKPPLYLENVK